MDNQLAFGQHLSKGMIPTDSPLRATTENPYIPSIMTDLSEVLEDIPIQYSRIRGLNLFNFEHLTNDIAQIERENDIIAIIPTSERGGPGVKLRKERQATLHIDVPHYRVYDSLRPGDVRNRRQVGTVATPDTINRKRLQIMQRLSRSFDFTFEWMMMNCFKGLVKDADGTILFDAFDRFGTVDPNPTIELLDPTKAFDADTNWERITIKTINLPISMLNADKHIVSMSAGGVADTTTGVLSGTGFEGLPANQQPKEDDNSAASVDNAWPKDAYGSVYDATTSSILEARLRGIADYVKKNALGFQVGAPIALCSESFWDKLTASPYVRAAYNNFMHTPNLNQVDISEIGFTWKGITFHRFFEAYQDQFGNFVPFVEDDTAYFIPNSPQLFQGYYAPADRFDEINQVARERYAFQYSDERNRNWNIEMEMNPIVICKRPEALIRVRFTNE